VKVAEPLKATVRLPEAFVVPEPVTMCVLVCCVPPAV